MEQIHTQWLNIQRLRSIILKLCCTLALPWETMGVEAGHQ